MMKEVYDLLDKIAPLKSEVRERCLSYIKEQLEKADGRSISFIDEDDEPIGGVVIVVTYDGGNHPEYAANPYSDVYGIYMKGDKIYIHREDCDEYDIDYVTYDDIVDIADFLWSVLKLE